MSEMALQETIHELEAEVTALKTENAVLREELTERDEEDAVVIPETGEIIAKYEREIAILKDEKQFLLSELRNRPLSQFGIIGGPNALRCPPSLMAELKEK